MQIPYKPLMSSMERKLFAQCLGDANHYFEFGSGGSTVWAVANGLTVYGVESDSKWVEALKACLGSECLVNVIDIGPTGSWGYPIEIENHHQKFPSYSRSIFEHDIPFDLVLVDGRFRVSCALSTIEYAMKRNTLRESLRIFIHDFWNRDEYHVVLRFLDTIDRVGTAGVFRLKDNIDIDDLHERWELYSKNPA